MKTVLLFQPVLLLSLRADDITLTDGTVFKNAKIVAHDDVKCLLSLISKHRIH